MNAYQLADELQDVIGLKNKPENKFSVLLRQQADRIEELELQLSIEQYLHKNLATGGNH